MASLSSFVACAWTLLAWTPVALSACQGQERPPFASDSVSRQDDDVISSVADASTSSPLIQDDEEELGAGTCGTTTIELEIQRPNFYFVLDSSESMLEPMPGAGGVTRHLAARRAIADMLRLVGHRVNFGAASFPSEGGCSPGAEVFPVREGDPLSESSASNTDGPALDGLTFTLRNQTPLGATPIAETLRTLAPELQQLDGMVSVFLLTDGAPNCDVSEPCQPNQCIPNIEALRLDDGIICGQHLDCCSPDNAPHLCLDQDDAVDAVAELADGGIRTFVIGIPGSETYEQVLSAMAGAADTARVGEETDYYQVQDAEDLALTLTDLGQELALSCDLDLGSAPSRPELIFVVAGDQQLARDDDNGWSWTDDSIITLTGDACDNWKQGNIARVQVFQGCPFTMK